MGQMTMLMTGKLNKISGQMIRGKSSSSDDDKNKDIIIQNVYAIDEVNHVSKS